MDNNQTIPFLIFNSNNLQRGTLMIEPGKKTLWRRIIYHDVIPKVQ